MLVTAINKMNEIELSYKMENKEENILIVFGLKVDGEKNRIEIHPTNEGIQITGIGEEKSLSEEEFFTFVDTMKELKVLQEQAKELIKKLVA